MFIVTTLVTYVITYLICWIVFNIDKKYLDQAIASWIDEEIPWFLVVVFLFIPFFNIFVCVVLIFTTIFVAIAEVSDEFCFEDVIEKIFIFKKKEKKDDLNG